MKTHDLGLADVVNLEDWQKMQDRFSEALEIGLQTVSRDGKPLTTISHPSRLCSEIMPATSHNERACSHCPAHITSQKPFVIDKKMHFICPLGLELSIVPVYAMGERIVAHIIVGPAIMKSRKPIPEYERDAKMTGIPVDRLMDALIEINVFSYNKMSSLKSLIQDMSSYMAQTGYHKRRLGEIAPEVVELDPVFSRYYEEKILRSLLTTCTMVLGADSGSVMTVDKTTNRLQIKVASKLDDEIVNTTNLKVGEGIAGMAAAKGEAIILPQDEHKRGLEDKMRRKDIVSSLIMPFSRDNAPDVYGVINLNVLRKGSDFTPKDVSLVKELVRMAGIALVPLRKSVKLAV